MTDERTAVIMYDLAYSAWLMSVKMMNQELFEDLNNPKIGDFVFENSNPFVPRLRAIGKLICSCNDSMSAYVIEGLDGKRYVWANAALIKVADKQTTDILNTSIVEMN